MPPGKSLSQRMDALEVRVAQLEQSFDTYKLLTDYKLRLLEERDAERQRTEDEFSQKIDELTEKLRQQEIASERHQVLVNHRLDRLEASDAERKRTEEELRNKVAELTAKNAALEERSRGQEKTSDRGWQLWLAALGFGFGLISLLVTTALQLKK